MNKLSLSYARLLGHYEGRFKIKMHKKTLSEDELDFLIRIYEKAESLDEGQARFLHDLITYKLTQKYKLSEILNINNHEHRQSNRTQEQSVPQCRAFDTQDARRYDI